MALSNFKQAFDNMYQEVFQKVLVGMVIANTRLEGGLVYGASVARVKYDISGVRVRSVTVGVDRTVDTVTDASEVLTVNREVGTTFALSSKEKVQAGPLNPGAIIGGKLAHKTATYVDADILFETTNAFAKFDNGDLTTLVSSGTPITMSSTTVPQLVSRAPAKLKRNNQVLTDLCWVADSYMASDFIQYLLGKNINYVESVFKNGFAGPIGSAELYVSENLTGTSILTGTGTFSDGEVIIVGGTTFTMKTTLSTGPAVAGEVLIGANLAASLTNLTAAINAPGTTSATFTALATADQINLQDNLRLSATTTSTVATLIGKGSGRLIVSETAANASFTANYIHSYFGKKGAIDVVIQDQVDMEMRDEPKQRATNILSDTLYGVKTFTDGAQQFLDVLIAV